MPAMCATADRMTSPWLTMAMCWSGCRSRICSISRMMRTWICSINSPPGGAVTLRCSLKRRQTGNGCNSIQVFPAHCPKSTSLTASHGTMSRLCLFAKGRAVSIARSRGLA